ncbi:MAG: hypothetical protein KJZ68_13865, partial [Phycisphaerales bacterium]|nr:hypothetical protein [Phycisphaerales bacterium]
LRRTLLRFTLTRLLGGSLLLDLTLTRLLLLSRLIRRPLRRRALARGTSRLTRTILLRRRRRRSIRTQHRPRQAHRENPTGQRHGCESSAPHDDAPIVFS